MTLLREAARYTVLGSALVFSSLAGAQLQTTLNYGCSGPNCSLGQTINLTKNDGSLAILGDGVGSVRGQAAYGLISGNVSSVWAGDFPPSYAGGGGSNSSAVDGLTFSGGSGSLSVTVSMRTEGTFAGGASTHVGGVGQSILNASVGLGSNNSARVTITDNSAQGNGGAISLACTVPCQWTSSDGSFSSNATIAGRPSASGTLTATFTVPYGTVQGFSEGLDIQANSSAVANATATAGLSVPSATSVSSTSGMSYLAGSGGQGADVPLPPWVPWVFGASLLAMAQLRRARCARMR